MNGGPGFLMRYTCTDLEAFAPAPDPRVFAKVQGEIHPFGSLGFLEKWVMVVVILVDGSEVPRVSNHLGSMKPW